jgi:hypothetical protein
LGSVSIVHGLQPQRLSEEDPLHFNTNGDGMPDTVKFVLTLAVIGGLIYGGAWALAHYPPEQTEIVKPISSEKLRQK